MKKQRKTIAFICVENARRSQMAEGFAKTFGQKIVEAYSAGSHPASRIDPLVIKVMKEKGIVWPGQSVLLKNPDPSKGRDFDIMPNSCGKCHNFARISGDND